MNSLLAESIKKYAPVPDEEILRFKNAMKSVSIKKGGYFIGPGQSDKKIGFVVRGIFRFFYIDSDGNEATRAFVSEGGFLASRETMYRGRPAGFLVESLEDSEILVSKLPSSEVFKGLESCWYPFLMAMMHERLAAKERRIEGFIMGNAESRYLDFLEDFPDVSCRVPQHYIASYLGISPVSLSRIRKRIDNKAE